MQLLDEAVEVLLFRAYLAQALLGCSLNLPQTLNRIANRALDLSAERFDASLVDYFRRHTIPREWQPMPLSSVALFPLLASDTRKRGMVV
jgi:hypothetical protein